MPPLEGDEEVVKVRKIIKTITLNKLLTTLSILLAQTKSFKFKKKIETTSDKYYVFCMSIINSLKHFITI